MEIINNVITSEPLATELETGTVFFCKGSFYLAVTEGFGSNTSFVNLTNFDTIPACLFAGERVKVVNAKLTLTN